MSTQLLYFLLFYSSIKIVKQIISWHWYDYLLASVEILISFYVALTAEETPRKRKKKGETQAKNCYSEDDII